MMLWSRVAFGHPSSLALQGGLAVRTHLSKSSFKIMYSMNQF
ncbi:hypothetical protein YPPY66_4703 [Yersinia pestis PY-66]|nr:hypothetical protein YPPY01_4285 [Yersinia pestis PY-01]EIQ84068.1 hypothetical protein YPPY02_4342 [Yersinia pestis PY-02]EIQ84138.1 hypothetical protein YPPY03_4423 [Yersinia pestis PY-03]EIQ97164.1 hypothetical protein YPPY04_4352 [Yersinia pestis PY-04]EIQ98307.1 hypothetical protein YPPY05_4330 [Yersinia pestis PY-05]EIR01598.1 hypothetical protein YPPY06_4389 [Yersinia pestis PY-06]EIR12570.1 hypothetical protein YPPY07_4252 [Yersinia pestis PY-07]EIR14388.1 hypothetical protein YPP